MAHPRIRVAAAALLCAALSMFAPRAFADGAPPEGDGPSIEEQIKAQIAKIVKLMRENEAALLDASLGTGTKPGPVDVKPLDPTAKESTPSEATAPTLKGEEIRTRLDGLLKTSQTSSAAIPSEIDELLRMIPC